MPKEFTYRITKEKINLMNQQEAQDLLNILKRRNLEERSSIENAYNVEKKTCRRRPQPCHETN